MGSIGNAFISKLDLNEGSELFPKIPSELRSKMYSEHFSEIGDELISELRSEIDQMINNG